MTALADDAPAFVTDWHRPVARAYLIILLAFGGVGGWAAVARLDSAAIAPGLVAAQSNRKTVQHLEGGIVREILARDGDAVAEGQVLARLDATPARAALDTVRNGLAVARAQEARLLAERAGETAIAFPPEALARRDEPVVRRALDDQAASLRERRTYLKAQVDVLGARVAQLEQEVRALQADAATARKQVETIDRELPGVQALYAKGLVALNRVTTLERERFRLNGLADRATSDAEKARRTIAETALQVRQAEGLFAQGVASDLIDVRKQIADLAEREGVTRDVLDRVEVRAPRAGIVQGSRVFTLGAVLRPGDTILEIAPVADDLVVRVQIAPTDMNVVREGMRAEIRFPSFRSRRVPIMLGTLRAVSFDRVADPQDPRTVYYQGEVVVDAGTVPAEIRDGLKAGLPADVIITTGERTPLDYLVSPLLDRIGRGMREK